MLCVQAFLHKDQTRIITTFFNTCSTIVLKVTVALTSISITPAFQIWRIWLMQMKKYVTTGLNPSASGILHQDF